GGDLVAVHDFDDLGVLQLVLEASDPGLHEPLFVLRRVVLGVLADVAVLAGAKQTLGDVVAALGAELLQLLAHPDVRFERQPCRRLLSRRARRSVGGKEVLVSHPPNLPTRAGRPVDIVPDTERTMNPETIIERLWPGRHARFEPLGGGITN